MGGLSIAIAGGCSNDDDQPVYAADTFVDSVGVNVHMSYSDTPYARVPEVRRAVRELGVRHVRDGLVLDRADQYRALRALAGDGARSDLILGDPAGRFGTGSLRDQVRTLETELSDAVETVEGPNEYDNNSDDPDFAATLQTYQERLNKSIDETTRLAGLEILAPSLVMQESYGELGDITANADFGNVHPYPGGQPPEASLEPQIEIGRSAFGDLPVMATETGYHNAINYEGDAQPGVPEEAAASYLPRLLLDYFRAGVPRTYLYELLDQRQDTEKSDLEGNFGLVRNDFSRKPAFTALRNTLDLLADPGPEFKPEYLGHSIVNGDGIRMLLLAKRDGSHYLALWRPGTALWSTDAKRKVTPDPVTVRVDFDQTVDAAAYYPVVSPLPRWEREHVESVRVELHADPAVVELR